MRDDCVQFLTAISDYHARIRCVLELFRKHKKVDMLDFVRASPRPPRHGYIDKGRRFKYSFHGAGCWAKTSLGEIDFDFNVDGLGLKAAGRALPPIIDSSGRVRPNRGAHLDGFDPWKLRYIVFECADRYPKVASADNFDSALDFLILSSIVKVGFGVHYIQADCLAMATHSNELIVKPLCHSK
jgi:hypothetical protein